MSGEIERETRIRRIDPRLQTAGWTPQAFRSVGESKLAKPPLSGSTPRPAARPTTRSAIAVMSVVSSKPRSSLSARRRSSSRPNATPEASTQRPQYQGQYGVPFLYSTNGEIIHFLDTRSPLNLSREVAGFHTPDALAELLRVTPTPNWPDSPTCRSAQSCGRTRSRPIKPSTSPAERRRKMLLTWRRAPVRRRDGQRGLPAHEVWCRPTGTVPRGPRALAARRYRHSRPSSRSPA